MIGKVKFVVVDSSLYCMNGWAGSVFGRRRSCSYTGGHSCDRLVNHQGRCRCACGATSTVKFGDEVIDAGRRIGDL